MKEKGTSSFTNYQGTARHQRQLAALAPSFVGIDEHQLHDLLAAAASYAKHIKYYNREGQDQAPNSDEKYNWAPFFLKDESVFLATLLSADLSPFDDLIQESFLNIHHDQSPEKQRSTLEQLIDSLLDLTSLLFSWHQQARDLRSWNEEHRIEQEIDRAMLGDLGIQFRAFKIIVRAAPQTFGLDKKVQSSWNQQLASFPDTWDREEQRSFIQGEESSSRDLGDKLKFAGARLQEYYRRLYFTMAYLMELSESLFTESITNRNDHNPQIGLFISFLKLFGEAQRELNSITGRHLDYYYEEVLGLRTRGGVPDATTICLETVPGVREVVIPSGTLFLAGVNAEGVPSHYKILRELIATPASVEVLKTVFVSKNPIVQTGSSYRLVSAIYAAPVANSADGQGVAFTGTDTSWPVLGEDQFDFGKKDRQMVTSTLGFAFCSSTLLVGEGSREVKMTLRFTPASFLTLRDLLDDIANNSEGKSSRGDIFSSVFTHPFLLSHTGPEGWVNIEKYRILPPPEESWNTPVLTLEFQLDQSAPAITPYDPSIHQEAFTTSWPVLKVLLSDQEAIYGYSFLRDLELEEISLKVSVKGVKNITANNDQGLLDASGPFLPFGPFPRKNSYFLFGHQELFNKPLDSMNVHIEWGETPETDNGFADHYAAYDQDITNESFTVRVSGLTDYAFQPRSREQQEEFPLFSSHYVQQPALSPHTTIEIGEASLRRMQFRPLFHLTELPPYDNGCRTGYFKFNLAAPSMAFGHALYPRLFARVMAENARPRPFRLFGEAEEEPLVIPNEPYTPVINQISLDYTASTTLKLGRLDQRENNPTEDNALFRLHPFGQETVYQKGLLTTPHLCPRIDEDGYLYIGIRDLHPPQQLSLFFDLEESEKKFSRGAPDVKWHYLHGEEWRPFPVQHILSDTTVKLSTSGILHLYCSEEMTRGTHLLGPDVHWIRASSAGNLSTAGRCRTILSNAVDASWIDNGDNHHLKTPPADRPPITEPVVTLAGISKVTQPAAFSKGMPAEQKSAYYVRNSERLRHKNRGVNVWDIERLVLESFPDIQQVKCIGKHMHEDILGIGEVLVVVIPRISGPNPTPRVGYHILQEIQEYLKSLSSVFADIRVINPVYERLKVSCHVKLTKESTLHRGRALKEVEDAIKNYVCPWLGGGSVNLGGSVSKTEILAIINECRHIQYTTGFSMVLIYEKQDDFYSLEDTAVEDTNAEILTASRPWSVLIPLEEHQIEILETDDHQFESITAIDRMRLEADFIILEEGGEDMDLPSPSGSGQDGAADFDLPPSWLTP